MSTAVKTSSPKLREAVDVVGLDAQGLLDILAHLFTPGLGPEDARLQGDLVGGKAHLLQALPQEGGVAGGAADDGGVEVPEEHDLPVGVAGAGGDGHAAQLVAAAVEARPAGEQAEAVGHLAHVLLGAAGGGDGPGAAVLPQVDVVLVVEGHHPLAGGAGGGVDADHVLLGHAHHPEGIALPQVVLGEEGQLIQVVDGLDVVGGDPLLLHLLPVVGHVVPHMADLLDQLLVLDLDDLFPGSALDLRLIVVFHSYHSLVLLL